MNLVKVDLQLVKFMEQEHEVIEIAVVSSLYDAGLQVEKSIPKESPPPPPPPPSCLTGAAKKLLGVCREGQTSSKSTTGRFWLAAYRNARSEICETLCAWYRSYAVQIRTKQLSETPKQYRLSPNSRQALFRTSTRTYTTSTEYRIAPVLQYEHGTCTRVLVPYLSCFIMPSPTLYPNNKQSPLGY